MLCFISVAQSTDDVLFVARGTCRDRCAVLCRRSRPHATSPLIHLLSAWIT
jgi:hypothetical protein